MITPNLKYGTHKIYMMVEGIVHRNMGYMCKITKHHLLDVIKSYNIIWLAVFIIVVNLSIHLYMHLEDMFPDKF